MEMRVLVCPAGPSVFVRWTTPRQGGPAYLMKDTSLCPFLPIPREGIDWRLLHAHRAAARGAEFYFECLEYGHALWRQQRSGRALLCLDRAFGAALTGEEAVLQAWPLPYAAMAWVLRYAPEGTLVGNPRVHFQHYADRMNEPRREQRRWRAWACWAIARRVLPQLPGDPRHIVVEPTEDEIAMRLGEYGFAGEVELWRGALC